MESRRSSHGTNLIEHFLHLCNIHENVLQRKKRLKYRKGHPVSETTRGTTPLSTLVSGLCFLKHTCRVDPIT